MMNNYNYDLIITKAIDDMQKEVDCIYRKNYHSVGQVPKSNRKIVETDLKLMPPTLVYMTYHFPGW